MRNSTSPAWVVNSRGRAPLRSVTRVSAAFVAGGADLLGRFDLDQLLHHQPHGIADQIDAFTGTERVQAARTRQTETGPSVASPSVCTWRNTPRITPMAPPTWWTPAGYLKAHHSGGRLRQANGHPMQNQ